MTDTSPSEPSGAALKSGAVGRLALASGILPGIGSGLTSFVFTLVGVLGVPTSSDFGPVSFFGSIIVLGVLALLAIILGLLGVQRSRSGGRLAAAAGIALGASYLLSTALGAWLPQLLFSLQ
jgi:hypothetical protein